MNLAVIIPAAGFSRRFREGHEFGRSKLDEEIAGRSVMDKVSVSRAVARLVDDGRVLRAIDPHDRRRSVLRLSRRGRAIYQRIIPLARAYERDLLSALDRGDRADLDRVLTRLTQRARSISPPDR